MSRRRKHLGDMPETHRAQALEWFEAARVSAEMAKTYAEEGSCVGATTALVRAAFNYGSGSAVRAR